MRGGCDGQHVDPAGPALPPAHSRDATERAAARRSDIACRSQRALVLSRVMLPVIRRHAARAASASVGPTSASFNGSCRW